MQLFSPFCIFMTPMSKGLNSWAFAYRHVNDLRSRSGVWHAPTVYLYRQLSCIISIALPSSICYDTPTDSSYARHCRHISHIFSISYFYPSCHADMFYIFFCPFGRYSKQTIPKNICKIRHSAVSRAFFML